MFSCNGLVGTKNRFGRHSEECGARGMRHNKALKAVARKRLKVVYSIMRRPRPYEEWPGAAGATGVGRRARRTGEACRDGGPDNPGLT